VSNTTPPQPDTTPPTVSVTAPAAGGTALSGSVTLSANAADTVDVVSVQFKVNGANVGAEDTGAPYSISWDSAGVANGSYVITALARDAAGNTTLSAGVSVTVSNGAANPPPNPQPNPPPPAADEGGGGCTIGRSDAVDPLLPLLALLAAATLVLRRGLGRTATRPLSPPATHSLRTAGR
jgi:hypothetical protein